MLGVSSTPLILDDQLCRTQINETIRNEKIKGSDAFSTEVKRGHKNPVSSFNYARETSLLYILQRGNDKHPLTSYLT